MRSNSIHFLLISLLVTRLGAMEPQQLMDVQRLDPLGDGISSLKLLSVTGNDLQIVNDARFAFGTYSETFSEVDQQILSHVIKRHKKALDLTSLRFHVKLPIKLAYDWESNNDEESYNEQSARYSKLANKYYVPQSLDASAAAIFKATVDEAFQAYTKLADTYGIPRELARGVLPKCSYTQFFNTCSLHTLLKCVKRAYRSQDKDMQQYANGLLTLARQHFPRTIDLWCEAHKASLQDATEEKKLEELAAAMPTNTQKTPKDFQESFDPLEDKISLIKLLQHNSSDLEIATAARISYNKHEEPLKDGGQNLLRTLTKRGHTSPFEQSFLEYFFKLPFFIARHVVRHRIGIHRSEEPITNPIEFYVPSNWRNKKDGCTDDEITAFYRESITKSLTAYSQLCRSGIPVKLAQYILPVSTYTQFILSCNIQSLMHFADLRTEGAAQWEVQQFARKMLIIALQKFPISIHLWAEKHKATWLDEQSAITKTLPEQPAEKKASISPEAQIVAFFSEATQPEQQQQ